MVLTTASTTNLLRESHSPADVLLRSRPWVHERLWARELLQNRRFSPELRKPKKLQPMVHIGSNAIERHDISNDVALHSTGPQCATPLDAMPYDATKNGKRGESRVTVDATRSKPLPILLQMSACLPVLAYWKHADPCIGCCMHQRAMFTHVRRHSVCMCVCMYIYIYIYVHTHTYIQ